MNVALTRARRHLFVVGDSQTASHSPFLKSMCTYLHEHGDLRTPQTTHTHNTDTALTLDTASTEAFAMPEDFIRKKDVKTEVKKDSVKKENSREVLDSHSSSSVSGMTVDSSSCKKDISNAPSNSTESSTSTSRDLTREEIFVQIETFSKGCDTELVFPCTLSARERAFVHEVSEELGLNHVSSGDGSKRQIVVSRMKQEAGQCVSNNVASENFKATTCPFGLQSR